MTPHATRRSSFDELKNLDDTTLSLPEWLDRTASEGTAGYRVDRRVGNLIAFTRKAQLAKQLREKAFSAKADHSDTTEQMEADIYGRATVYTNRSAHAAGLRMLRHAGDPRRLIPITALAVAVIAPAVVAVVGAFKTGLDTGQAITGRTLRGKRLTDEDRAAKVKGAALGWAGIGLFGVLRAVSREAEAEELAPSSGELQPPTERIPGRVETRINVSNEGWAHVVARHFFGTGSRFTVSEGELREMLTSRSVIDTPISRVLQTPEGPRYVRTLTYDWQVGLDKLHNFQPTSTLTVISDRQGNLLSAFPGRLP